MYIQVVLNLGKFICVKKGKFSVPDEAVNPIGMRMTKILYFTQIRDQRLHAEKRSIFHENLYI